MYRYDQVHVGVVSSGACGAPFDGVDLLLVGLQVMYAVVPVHGPHLNDHGGQVLSKVKYSAYFQRHVITARSQKLSLRVPLDSIDLIGVALEGLDGPVLVQLADVDLLVCGAGGKTLLRLPENIR